MRIGEVAARAGVSVQALRYYEREGLLRAPARTEGGYRSYGPRELEQVEFIKQCQGLGFALREIRELAAMHDDGPQHGEFMRIAQQRLAYLDAKLAAYRTLRRQVAALVRRAQGQPAAGCPAAHMRK